jgi:hypothetical protein
MGKAVFDVVSDIQEAVKDLGLEVTAFDGGRELFSREGESEINVRFALKNYRGGLSMDGINESF